MNTYKVVVTREGDNWLADVPEVPGAHTFARSLDGLAKSAREVIVLMDDLADDAVVEIEYVYDTEDAAILAGAELARERREVAAREADVQARTAAAARELTGSGLSVRDSAHILGITAGRVSQLTNA